MYISEIVEARKNPEQNPKTSINRIIYDAYHTAAVNNDYVPGTEVLNVFISMTQYPKLGINPRSGYNTPLGIYAYPCEYVKRMAGSRKSLKDALPFAGEEENVNLFKAKGNIINLATMTNDEKVELYKKMGKVYADIAKEEFGHSWKRAVDDLEKIIDDASSKAKFSNMAGGQFWYVTMVLSRILSETLGTEQSVQWNKLFRSIGVDGCIDYDPDLPGGKGIIHTNEPSQAVFFSINGVTDVKRYNNKYSHNDIEDRKREGKYKKTVTDRTRKKYAATSDEELMQIISSSNDTEIMRYMLNRLTDETKKEILKQNPASIAYFKKPSEELQRFAIDNEPETLSYPGISDKIKIEYLLKDLSNIQHIYTPSYDIQKLVVTKKPEYAKYIRKLNHSLQEYLIRQNKDYYKLIRIPAATTKSLYKKLYNETPPAY